MNTNIGKQEQKQKEEGEEKNDQIQLETDKLHGYIQNLKEGFSENLSRSLKNPKYQNYINSMLGSVVGAALGDAIGTTIQRKPKVTEEMAESCLVCPGGGPYKLDAGQVTDDTELALTISHGLIETLKNGLVYELNTQAQHYVFWYNSFPFDIGFTTAMTFSQLDQSLKFSIDERVDSKENKNQLDFITPLTKASAENNADSQSNGCLMRIAPLAIYGLLFEKMQDFVLVVKQEISLTHPKEFMKQVCAFYCLLIVELIKNNGKRTEALEYVLQFSEKNFSNHSKIVEWVQLGKKDHLIEPELGRGGHAMIAFAYTIHCLVSNLNYRDSMYRVLLAAHDTDTNCCIVGAVIGACEGFFQIPSEQYQVLEFLPDHQDHQEKRPEYFSCKYLVLLTGLIIDQLDSRQF